MIYQKQMFFIIVGLIVFQKSQCAEQKKIIKRKRFELENIKKTKELNQAINQTLSLSSLDLLKESKETQNIETIQSLLKNNANPNIEDEKKQTPLFFACRRRRLDIVQLLLNNGANINHKDNQGETPLFIAIKPEQNQDNEMTDDEDDTQSDIIEELLIREAQTTITNNAGESPLTEKFSEYLFGNEKTKVRRDIPLSKKRKETTLLKDFDECSLKKFIDHGILIYNNDTYCDIKTPIRNDDKILKEKIESGDLQKNVNLFKGNPLFSPRQELSPDPIGYFLYLPKNVAQTQAIIVTAYGGADQKNKEQLTNTFFNISLGKKISYYLLSKNIGIMQLNTIDLKDNNMFQAIMEESIYKRILNNIHSVHTYLANPEQRTHIHSILKDLQLKLPLYFYGASFGGGLGIRVAQTYPNTFHGYISHDGTLAQHNFKPYLNPLHYVKDLQDNLLILQNYTDNRVKLDSQIQFYNELKKEKKDSLVSLHFFPEANLTVENMKKKYIGHFRSNEPWYLQEYTQTLLDFIENTKHGRFKKRLPMPQSVQEIRTLFHKTAYQEHSKEGTILEKLVSIGFKIYKNALQWRDPKIREERSFEQHNFMTNWFNLYINKNKIKNQDFGDFLSKALDILSDDPKETDESWRLIYRLIFTQNLEKNIYILPDEDIAKKFTDKFFDDFKERGKTWVQQELQTLMTSYKITLIKTLNQHKKIMQTIVKEKLKEALSYKKSNKSSLK